MATRIGVGLGHRRPLIPITDGSRPLGKAAPDNRPEPPLTPRERRMADLFANATNGLPAEAITSALYGNYEPYATALRDAYLAIQPELADLILEEYGDAGTQTAEQTKTEVTRLYRRMGLFRKETITPEYMVSSFRFDRTSPQARRYAQSTASRLVTNTTAEGVETLRAVVTEAYTVGRTPQTLAQNLYTALNNQDAFQPTTEGAQTLARFFGVQAHGLTTRYEQAVVNRATTLANDLAARGITGEKAAKEIQKKSQAYADKLRRARSKTIARTELLAANNAGKLASMKEAVDQGLASRENSRKQWRTGRFDVCPICVNLHSSEPVPLDEDFAGRFAYPPAHPNCRCTIAFLPNIEHYQPGKPYGTNTPDDPLGIKPPDGGGITPGEPLPGLPEGVAPQAELVDVPAPTIPEPDFKDQAKLRIDPMEDAAIEAEIDFLRSGPPRGRLLHDLVHDPAGSAPFGWKESAEAKASFDALDKVGEEAHAALKRVVMEGVSPQVEAKIASATKSLNEAVSRLDRAVLLRQQAQYQAILDQLDTVIKSSEDETANAILAKVRKRIANRLGNPYKQAEEYFTAQDITELKKAYSLNRAAFDSSDLREIGLIGRNTAGERYSLANVLRRDSETYDKAHRAVVKAMGERDFALGDLRRLDPMKDKNKVAEAVRRVLETNRPGYGTAQALDAFNPLTGTKAKYTQAITEGGQQLPAIWIKQIVKRFNGRLNFVKTSRGYFQQSTGTLAISDAPRGHKWVVTHELTHAAEYSVSGLLQAEDLFYNRRAAAVGGKPRRVSWAKGEYGYDLGIGDYNARVYDFPGWELLSMGVEQIMRGEIQDMPDDYIRFVLGCLLRL